jgi:hypothetical protein
MAECVSVLMYVNNMLGKQPTSLTILLRPMTSQGLHAPVRLAYVLMCFWSHTTAEQTTTQAKQVARAYPGFRGHHQPTCSGDVTQHPLLPLLLLTG